MREKCNDDGQRGWPPSLALLQSALEAYLVSKSVLEVRPLVEKESDKGFHLSDVCRVLLKTSDGEVSQLLLRRGRTGGQGQEFDADVWREVLGSFRACSDLPRHSKPVCILIRTQTGLTSSSAIEDMYLVEEFIDGTPYYRCLEALDHGDESFSSAEVRVNSLVQYLVQLHGTKIERPEWYLRRIRDLIGSGDGFLGVLDSYLLHRSELNDHVLRLLAEIEGCLPQWRMLLRCNAHRLCRIHGDFHPWNVIFTDDKNFRVIDCSRGGWGDSADDVSAMAVNFIFFGLRRGLTGLSVWSRLFLSFLAGYMAASGDGELPDLISPFLAHRLCVLASPQWYPSIDLVTRDTLLSLAADLLRRPFLTPEDLLDRVSALSNKH